MAATARKVTNVRRDGGVRLTRRGRVVLILLVASIVLVGLWLTAGRGAVAGAPEPQGPAGAGRGRQMVTVGGRDTLWDIAVRNRPAVDPRVTVQQIIDLNALPGAIIQPGQRLALPG